MRGGLVILPPLARANFCPLPIQRADTLVAISVVIVELSVGVCMLLVVSWLLLFRIADFKQCWARHARIRYYFGLTLLATVVNITLGVCGFSHAPHVSPR